MRDAALTDAQIYEELLADPSIIQGLDISDWSHQESHIQPCSVDLHVGDIYVPGESSPDGAGSLRSRNELTLSTGQTAVVVSRERLKIPRNLAAYGFPPSHLSSGGLLMTNPGHIDPGYAGNLRFTVINMSAEPFAIRRGDPIVTLIVHRLECPVTKDFTDRRTAAGLGALADPSWEDVNRLAKDFVDVEARSKRIASTEVQVAQDKLNRLDSRTKWMTAIIGLVAVLGTVLVGWLTGMQSLRSDVNDIKGKVEIVELKNEIQSLSARVAELEKRPRGGQRP